MAAGVTLEDGTVRFVWSETRPDQTIYAGVILSMIAELEHWRSQYEQAKATVGANRATGIADNSFGNQAAPP